MKISDSRHRLKELMEMLNINQTEFCHRTGLNKSALSNYLNGDRVPRQDKIALIADAFGVDPAWLMGYDTAPYAMPNITTEEEMFILEYRSADQTTKEMIHRLLMYKEKYDDGQRNKN